MNAIGLVSNALGINQDLRNISFQPVSTVKAFKRTKKVRLVSDS